MIWPLLNVSYFVWKQIYNCFLHMRGIDGSLKRSRDFTCLEKKRKKIKYFSSDFKDEKDTGY